MTASRFAGFFEADIHPSPFADCIVCALCGKPGHVAKVCPETRVGRLRAAKLAEKLPVEFTP